MINKEIKVGDKIWINSSCVDKESGFTVSSVKKDKTLVTVVIDIPAYYGYKECKLTMYGHASSSILSGFGRNHYYQKDICFTCDYSIIEDKTRKYEWDRKRIDAGMALLQFAKYFK